MKHCKLGNTGVDISRICVGCMSYGEPDRGDADSSARVSTATHSSAGMPPR